MADLIGDVVQPPAKIYAKISHWDVFFGSDKTRKKKNGRNLIRWGFERGEVITTQKWFGTLLLLILTWGTNPTRLWNMAMARGKPLLWWVPAPISIRWFLGSMLVFRGVSCFARQLFVFEENFAGGKSSTFRNGQHQHRKFSIVSPPQEKREAPLTFH